MNLVITSTGNVRAIYDETIDLALIGPQQITRASHVEPDAAGQWLVDLSPVGGPRLGPFARRSEALSAEVVWLAEHWLNAAQS